jgi:hypothetical protein
MFQDLKEKRLIGNDHLINIMENRGYKRIGKTFTKFECDSHEIHFKRIKMKDQRLYKGMIITNDEYDIASFKIIPNKTHINKVLDKTLELLSDMDLMIALYEDDTIQFVNTITRNRGKHKFKNLLEAIQKIPVSRFEDYATYMDELYRQINDGIHDFTLSNNEYLREYLLSDKDA